uniref:FBA_2 domain-containing protein n=1 Tax=Caenorhabditis japonica TaxID=281687 RepID=A0A8R1DN61_CAEJA
MDNRNFSLQHLIEYYPVKQLLFSTCSDPIESFEMFLILLQQIFRPPESVVLSVNVRMFSDFERIKKWKIHCGKLHMLLETLDATNKVIPIGYILDNFPMTNFRCLRGKVEQGFKYENPIKIRTIRIHGHWITIQNLIDMDSAYIYVRSPNLTVEDLKLYVEKWMSGETGLNLKCLCIGFLPLPLFHETFSKLEVYPMSKIEYRRGDLDWNRHYRNEPIAGFDVRRKSTNMAKATVRMEADSETFLFHVHG